jgi:adenine-specific DNA methylase
LYYLGSKHSFTDVLVEAINEVDPTRGRACDLFAGTGAVALALSSSRAVTTVDVQAYSRVLCSAQLHPAALTATEASQIATEISASALHAQLRWALEPLISYEARALVLAGDGDLFKIVNLVESQPLAFLGGAEASAELSRAHSEASKRLETVGLADSAKSTISRQFGGIYFSFEQAIFLDAAIAYAKHQSTLPTDVLLAAALSTASAIVNTVGKQFAQPIRPRDKHGNIKDSVKISILKDRSAIAALIYGDWLSEYGKLTATSFNHKALQMDYLAALDTLGKEFSVIYADPPYTRDHYSRFYHVLETMCLHDSPEIAHVKKAGLIAPSRGVYRKDRHQSPFCVRSEAPKAFADLFARVSDHGLSLVLSYSPHETGDGTHPRVLSEQDLISLARRYYRRIERVTIDGSSHNRFNRSDLNLKTRLHAEILFKCQP